MRQGQDNAETFSAAMGVVRQVANEAARRATEIDEQRSFPAELFDQLESAGVFRSLTPKAYGGLDLSLCQVNELVIEGGRGNGSLGWLMMIGTAQGLGHGNYPKEFHEKHPNRRTRGVFAPKGTAIPTEGGYIVSGQWPFASGGPDPDFVTGNCIVMRDGKPSIRPDGVPEMVTAIMSAEDLEPLDTWHVLGMRGTDSRDFAASEIFVPFEKTIDIYHGKNFFDTPAARLPIRVALATGHAAVALGIARGALDDITTLAQTKKASMNPKARLADDPVFRHTLGEQTLRYTAVKAMLDQMSEQLEEIAGERPITPTETLLGRTMPAYITAECVKIVDAAYTWGGSTSVYNTSSLQRRLRDIHVATQHVAAVPEPYRTLAATLLGDELSPMELF